MRRHLLRLQSKHHAMIYVPCKQATCCCAMCAALAATAVAAHAGTSLVVPVHPGLRIFATQNSAAYANRHALPLSIRSRFLEVQVGCQWMCSSYV